MSRHCIHSSTFDALIALLPHSLILSGYEPKHLYLTPSHCTRAVIHTARAHQHRHRAHAHAHPAQHHTAPAQHHTAHRTSALVSGISPGLRSNLRVHHPARRRLSVRTRTPAQHHTAPSAAPHCTPRARKHPSARPTSTLTSCHLVAHPTHLDLHTTDRDPSSSWVSCSPAFTFCAIAPSRVHLHIHLQLRSSTHLHSSTLYRLS